MRDCYFCGQDATEGFYHTGRKKYICLKCAKRHRDFPLTEYQKSLRALRETKQ